MNRYYFFLPSICLFLFFFPLLVWGQSDAQQTDDIARELQAARDKSDSLAKEDHLFAWLRQQNEIARIIGRKQNDPEGALAHMEEAWASRPSNPETEEELRQTGKFFTLIGFLHYRQGNFVEAIPNYESALTAFREVGRVDEYVGSHILNPLGNCYTRLGDREKAYSRLQLSLALCRDSVPAYQLAFLYSDLGILYEEMEDYSRAAESYAEGIALLSQADNSTDNSFALGLLKVNYGNLVLSCVEELPHHNSEQGVRELMESEPLIRTSLQQGDNQEGYPQLAFLYRALGEHYTREQDYPLAEQYHRKSFAALDKAYPEEFRREYAKSHSAMGDLYLAMEKPIPALEQYELALLHALQGRTWSDRLSLDDSLSNQENAISEAFFGQARAWELSYNLNGEMDDLIQAVKCHQRMTRIDDLLQKAFSKRPSKDLLSADRHQRLDHAIHICLVLESLEPGVGWAEQAFWFAENSRAAVYLELFMLREMEEGIPNYLQQMRATDALEENQKDPGPISQPNIAGIVDLRLIQGLLQESGQTLVEYHIGSQWLTAFVISGDSLTSIHIPKPDGLFQITKSFHDAIQEYQVTSNAGLPDPHAPKGYATLSHQLYQLLWEPLIPKGIEPGDRIVIIPDGPTYNFPFSCLITSQEFSDHDHSADFFPHPVSYAYSASLLYHQEQKNQVEVDQRLLTISPGEFVEGYSLQEIIPLLEELADDWGGKSLVGQEASLDKVLANWQEAALLLFYSHGLPNDSVSPAHILLTHQPSLPKDSSRLSLDLLYGLEHQLNAELVILMGCQTNFGDVTEGEGVVSLAEGFFFTGVPATMASPWEIPRRNSEDLIRLLMEELRTGAPKDVALFVAQERFREEIKHPYPVQWAALSLIGSSRPLTQLPSPPLSSYWWLLGFLLPPIAVWFWRRRKKN